MPEWQRREAKPFTREEKLGNRDAVKHGVWAADIAEHARRLVGDLFPADMVERHPMMALRMAELWLRLRRAELDIVQRGVDVGGRVASPSAAVREPVGSPAVVVRAGVRVDAEERG